MGATLLALAKSIYYLRQEAKNLVKKYKSAYFGRLMQREGLRKILWNPYQIWTRSCRILDKMLCNLTRSYRNSMES